MMSQSPGQLIQKFLDNTLSETEHNQLIDWFAKLPDQEAEAFFDNLGEKIDQLDEEKLLLLESRLLQTSRSKHRDKHKKSVVKLSSVIYRVAASVILILSLSLLFKDKFLSSSQKPSASSIAEKKNNEVQKSKLTLPDGTEVWLNGSSTIRFPKEFNGEKRDVYLVGEAFFKVAHDENRPFTVHAPSGLYAKVLGTSFNVRAYESQEDISVAVVTGRVAVGKGNKLFKKLSKGEQIVFNKGTSTVQEKHTVNANAWISQDLSFNGNTLKEVASMLESAYNVKIEFTDDVNQDLRCKGSFNLTQQPEEIIRVLCSLHTLQYSSQPDKIIVRKE